MERKKEYEKRGSKKGSENKIDFVKWFSELNKDSGNIAGGKGANLAEIYNLKIPVPPGFVVTAQAYDYFIEKAGLKNKITEILAKIDYENTKQLDETTKEIRELINNAKFPKELETEIIEAYEDLGVDQEKFGTGKAHEILKASHEPTFVAVRSSATLEDLAEASFAGQQDTYLNIKGQTELLRHIKKCFASLFTARATYYRHKKGFKHEKVSLAVIVQKMIDSDNSGVIFSKDPSFKNENTLIEAVFGLGEGIVSGKITPDRYTVSKNLEIIDKKIAEKKIAITRNSSGEKETIKLRQEKSKSQVLKDHEIIKLTEIALKLEDHYKKPQDIEFAIESDGIFIVQTRPITTLEKRVKTDEIKELQGEVVLSGLAASPGIAFGKIKIIHALKDLHKIKQGDILVTTMTNPDMVVTMQKSSAIVTDEGGLTSHAAIISREMGIPAVVGTQEATSKLKENEIITVNGFTGKIYKGKVSEVVLKEVAPVTAQTKTEIKVIVDLPSYAQRAAKSGVKKVGLTRMEGIIAESGKHPEYFLKENKINEYEEIIYKGITGIAQYFNELWIRTSDIRSDEYSNLKGAPEEPETNPMLGFHGIRYSLKKPEILKAELNALKRVSEQGKKIGILMPQLILIEELKKVKQILKSIGANKIKIGVMIETPAAVQIIKELCEQGIDFISFGTNDLTQYMLAVDRGNEYVQYLYDDMHPAILYQLAYVIRVCKRYKIETSICGQAGSKKPMVKYLVENGISSISVNPDMASEIAEYVAELEKQQEKQKQIKPKKQEKQIEEKTIQEPTKELPPQITEKPDVPDIEGHKPAEKTEKKTEQNIKKQDVPEIRGAEVEKDIEAIEAEKQEYLKEHPEEKEEAETEQSSEENKEEEQRAEEQETEDKKSEQKEKKEEVLDIF